MSRSSVRNALLLSLAVPTAVTAVWALAAPAAWFRDFPGFGRHWLGAFGPYDEHLARDFGGALLALAVLLLWTALAPHAPLRRALPASFLFFAVPHLAFHVAHAGELSTGDDVVNLVLLALSVAIPAALLLLPEHEPMRSPPAGLDGRRLPPARPRGLVPRITYRVSRRRFGHVLGPFETTAHNPILLTAYAGFELALERADRVDRRLEELGAQRAATMTGCPFCIDFGEALLGRLGLDAEQVREVPRWRESGAFSEDQRLVLEYAEAMSATPVAVGDELFARLRARFDEPAIVELTAAIAFENYRGRFNHALGLGSEGFCELPANGRPAVEAVR
ncbi:MAG: carboxymuconolactone decarboxylase family protein [Thermoleophilaceae bacterium]